MADEWGRKMTAHSRLWPRGAGTRACWVEIRLDPFVRERRDESRRGRLRVWGHDGFREFSHRKAVYSQLKKDIGPLVQMRPPYGAGFRKYLDGAIKR